MHSLIRLIPNSFDNHISTVPGRINADGVVGLTRAFLAAGAQCVLFCLWPVPEMAAKILLKTFYTALLKVRFLECNPFLILKFILS